MDLWQDVHAQACKAEHEVMMQALGYITAGSPPPSRHQIAAARALRDMASRQFSRAMGEIQELVDRTTLGAHLRRPSGPGSSSSPAPGR
jgi:hypothetical protein